MSSVRFEIALRSRPFSKRNSSAGAYLVGYFGRHHPEIARRVVISENVQASRLTDREIFAEGRKLLAPLEVLAGYRPGMTFKRHC